MNITNTLNRLHMRLLCATASMVNLKTKYKTIAACISWATICITGTIEIVYTKYMYVTLIFTGVAGLIPIIYGLINRFHKNFGGSLSYIKVDNDGDKLRVTLSQCNSSGILTYVYNKVPSYLCDNMRDLNLDSIECQVCHTLIYDTIGNDTTVCAVNGSVRCLRCFMHYHPKVTWQGNGGISTLNVYNNGSKQWHSYHRCLLCGGKYLSGGFHRYYKDYNDGQPYNIFMAREHVISQSISCQ